MFSNRPGFWTIIFILEITVGISESNNFENFQLPSCEKYGLTSCESTNKCIKKSQVCDGHLDCNDGSDESKCKNVCKPNESYCVHNRCILKSWICDGENDCSDGSDELNCDVSHENNLCFDYEFKCDNGKCIRNSFRCDRNNDCDDNSDETGCSEPVITGTLPHTVNLLIGETFQLNCSSEGFPMPVVYWRYNNVSVPLNCIASSSNGSGTLVCKNVEIFDSGYYSCEAINYMGSQTILSGTNLIVYEI